MEISPCKYRNHSGFTLIELITVIAIIAVLIGLLFPVANSVTNSAKKTQAAADIKSIITSSSSYQADYGKLPLTTDQMQTASTASRDTLYGNPGGSYPGYMLYDILRARVDQENTFNTNNEYNPKKVVYFEASNVKNPDSPRGGFATKKIDSGTSSIKVGSLVDPWGSEYTVFFDANGDGDLNEVVKTIYASYQRNFGPRGSVCAACMGADKTWGLNNSQTPDNTDDVVSWK